MVTGAKLNQVMNAFKADGRFARYAVDHLTAQSAVNELSQGELIELGLTGFLTAQKTRGGTYFGAYGPNTSQPNVNVRALFGRMDALFPNARLPESKGVTADISLPCAFEVSPVTSIFVLFGAMKAAGAQLSCKMELPRDGESNGNDVVMFHRGDGAGVIVNGSLEAVFEQEDVKLSCRARVVGTRISDRDWRVRKVSIKELDRTILFRATLPRHSDVAVGNAVLESGLRTILSPMVDGVVPFRVSGEAGAIVAGIRGTVVERYLSEASEELGIGMDGTVTIPE